MLPFAAAPQAHHPGQERTFCGIPPRVRHHHNVPQLKARLEAGVAGAVALVIQRVLFAVRFSVQGMHVEFLREKMQHDPIERFAVITMHAMTAARYLHDLGVRHQFGHRGGRCAVHV